MDNNDFTNTNISHLIIDKAELQPRISDALRYLGYRPGMSDSFFTEAKIQLEKVSLCVRDALEPQFIFKVFDLIKTSEEDNRLSIYGSLAACEKPLFEIPGKYMADILKNCEKVILFAATIGHAVSRLTDRTQVTDMAKAVMMDACASSAAEMLVIRITKKLSDIYKEKGLYLTDRFSPGYGDFPLDFQKVLCGKISAEKLAGITLTKSLSLVPEKSITGIIGIAKTPQPMIISGCSYCSMAPACSYKKEDHTCGRIY